MHDIHVPGCVLIMFSTITIPVAAVSQGADSDRIEYRETHAHEYNLLTMGDLHVTYTNVAAMPVYKALSIEVWHAFLPNAHGA